MQYQIQYVADEKKWYAWYYENVMDDRSVDPSQQSDGGDEA